MVIFNIFQNMSFHAIVGAICWLRCVNCHYQVGTIILTFDFKHHIDKRRNTKSIVLK